MHLTDSVMCEGGIAMTMGEDVFGTGGPTRLTGGGGAHATRARGQRRAAYLRVVGRVLSTVVTVSAAAVLVSTLVTPVLRVYGTSMTPSLDEGDVLVCVRSKRLSTGDVVAFYYGNKLLVKRCVAGPGDWVDIAEDGTVSVNGARLDEPYVTDPARGKVEVDLPYQVPDGSYFLMGDHRSTSIDSRSKQMGCVPKEQVVGRLVLRLWPLDRLGGVASGS